MTMPTYSSVKVKVGKLEIGSGANITTVFTAKEETYTFGEFGKGQIVGQLGTWTEFGLAKFIRRIEFMVGTQVWQTMENNDLLNCLNAESYESAYTNLGFQCNGGNTSVGNIQYERDIGPVYSGASYAASFKLPLLTKTLGPNLNKFVNQTEDGYLMAAAPHQTVKIRVTYESDLSKLMTVAKYAVVNQTQNDTFPDQADIAGRVNRIGEITSGFTDTDIRKDIKQISTSLYGKHQVMCNAERQQLRNMAQGLPKRIKMTQNASLTTEIKQTGQVTVDLDHFSLFASALVVNVSNLDSQTTFSVVDPTNSDWRPGTQGSTTAARLYNTSDTQILDAPASALEQAAMLAQYRPVTTTGALHNAELILNSSSISGVLPGFFLTSSAADSMGLFSNYYFAGSQKRAPGSGYSVFPLSSHAYDASAVPLNRFDNIRLRLSCNQGSKQGSQSVISVTCLGETTALYKGGAASLAMY